MNDTARNAFCAYLCRGLKKLDNMTLLWGSFQLYNDLKADYEIMIGERNGPSFLNIFSAEHCNVFVQQQEQYLMMVMDEFMEKSQIFHSTDQPVYKQRQCTTA